MLLSLLDWASVGHAGRGEPVSRIVRDLVAGEGGSEQAGVFGLAGKVPARAAALANGTISHALDYDDTHFLHVGHPSVAVVSAALAVAEKIGAGGPAMADAALIGAEGSCRIGAWLGRAHYQAGFHQTATAGCFGATMAASRLLGLDEIRAGHALGIASTRASGLKSQFGTMGKPYNAGMAAANGVEAALLAGAGFVSRPDGLECPQGFGETHSGENNSLDECLAGLGETFVFETVQHKFHACCHGLHAGLEALHAARQEHSLAAEDIEAVELTVNPRWLKVCNIMKPRTGLEAKFSYRLTAAMALAGRDTGALSTYTDEVCEDPVLISLRDRVEVKTDDHLTDTGTRIVIRTVAGGLIEASHELARPIPYAQREQKVRAKSASLLGSDVSGALWDRVMHLSRSDEPVSGAMLMAGA
jgi:2-methylcitrate dehydratase PrpD